MAYPTTTYTDADPTPASDERCDFIEAVLHTGRRWVIAEIGTCIENLQIPIQNLTSGTQFTQEP